MYGDGSIIERGNKYQAYYSHKGKRFSKVFSSKTDAHNWLVSMQNASGKNAFVAPNKVTFGQWVVEYLNTYAKPKVKQKTLARYVCVAKSVQPIADYKLQALTPLIVQQFINTMPSDSKKHKVYDFINRTIKKAVAVGMLATDIMLAVDAPAYSPAKLATFSDAEISRIKSVLKHYDCNTFVLAAFATGCRISELCGLKISDIHNNYIHIEREVQRNKGGWYVETPKSKYSVRNISVPASVIDMLKKEFNRPPVILNGFVFHRADGQPLLPDFIQRQWKKILLEANVPYRNFHYIRHTHATNLLHHFDAVEVQHRLGHSLASTTLDMYGHTKDEYQPTIANAVAKIFGL